MERTSEGGVILSAEEANLLADALNSDRFSKPEAEKQKEAGEKAVKDAELKKQILSEKNQAKRQEMIKKNMHLFSGNLHGRKRG